MKNRTLDISKEFYENCDAGSNTFTVTVKYDSIVIQGKARNIFEENTFHLGAELEELLEKKGIDPYDIVLALENGNRQIDIKVEKKRYAIIVDLYIYADDDTEAKELAKEVTAEIDNIGGGFNDNKASIVSLHETPYGKIGQARGIEC